MLRPMCQASIPMRLPCCSEANDRSGEGVYLVDKSLSTDVGVKLRREGGQGSRTRRRLGSIIGRPSCRHNRDDDDAR